MPDRSLTDIFRDCAGTVVYSVAGRDKKRPFVIVGVADEDSGTVYIADGALHTLSSPKRKKLKHLRVTDSVLRDFTHGTDDDTLCGMIREWESQLPLKDD